jgi:hypothetical protein
MEINVLQRKDQTMKWYRKGMGQSVLCVVLVAYP